MAFKYSTGFKNAALDTGSIKSQFETMKIKLYDGAIPATANDAEAGTLLCTFTGPADVDLDLADNAADGQITKLSSQVWSGVAAATGTATHFRAETSTDDQTESTTQKRIQGTVGTTAAYDMQMSSTAITSGDTYTLDYFVLNFLGG